MTVEPERMTAKETTLARSAELWLVDLARSAPALEAQEREVPRLGPRDRGDIEVFEHADVRQRRLTAHLALRILFERRLGHAVRGQDLERPQGAKPRLNASLGLLDFSLAHAEGEALIGITTGAAIGVDLEDVRPVRIAGARRRRILAAGATLVAAAGIGAGSEEEAFMRAWVRLEALAKAQGAGLARTLAALGLRQALAGDSTDVARRVEKQLSLMGLRVHDLALGPGRVAAVALDAALAMPPLSTFPVNAAGIEELLRAPQPGGSREAR
jgi:4'-phosphopantetheinyl transferase